MSLKSTIKSHYLTIDLRGHEGGLSARQRLTMASIGARADVARNNQFSVADVRDFRRSSVTVIGQRNRVRIDGKAEHCQFQIDGSDNTITMDPGCHFTDTDFTVIASNSWIHIGSGSTGNGKTHAPNLFLVRGHDSGIDVGKDVMQAYGIEVRNTDSHKIYDASGTQINLDCKIAIGAHVWLGARSTVLKGSTIESGCVIATGAIVSGAIPANVIAAGAPAKPIRADITWQR